jgi:hypothetical protein
MCVAWARVPDRLQPARCVGAGAPDPACRSEEGAVAPLDEVGSAFEAGAVYVRLCKRPHRACLRLICRTGSGAKQAPSVRVAAGRHDVGVDGLDACS